MPVFQVVSIVEPLINPIFTPARVGKNELLILEIGRLMFVHKERINGNRVHRLFIVIRLRVNAPHLKLASGNPHHALRGRGLYGVVQYLGAVNPSDVEVEGPQGEGTGDGDRPDRRVSPSLD